MEKSFNQHADEALAVTIHRTRSRSYRSQAARTDYLEAAVTIAGVAAAVGLAVGMFLAALAWFML